MKKLHTSDLLKQMRFSFNTRAKLQHVCKAVSQVQIIACAHCQKFCLSQLSILIFPCK